MDTSPLKSFATSARTELLREVGARLTAVLTPGSPERVEQPGTVAALERAIAGSGGGDAGRAHVVDKVAYTWFNRIVALRFMDANGYTGIGIVSPAADQIGQPEVLAAAKRGQADTSVVKNANAIAVTGLLNGTRQPRPGVDAQAEAYALLLADYCRHWNRAMPFMFERDGDYTELLVPANLLAADSVLGRSVEVLTEAVCQDVEVIGWLYQFYISKRKDEVFAGFKKNKKAGADEIPAATQLFTPHWIVRYLVENSVGRLWMLNHPQSRLVEQMTYYIAPDDEETDFLRITAPEDLQVIDPACGSGHMLTYAFDLLYSIYEEEGYAPSQIPGLILTHNLFGIEIDERAGALAAFALTMKAAARRKLFLKDPITPKVCVLAPISFTASEMGFLVTSDGDRHAQEKFWNQFADADTFGSLIRPDSRLTVRLSRHLDGLDDGGDLLRADALDWARRVIDQATYLTRQYGVVVANPPYMGSKQMNALLSQFMKDEYPTSKADLFAGFIERAVAMVRPNGYVAQVTMQSWMFLSSYEALRSWLHHKTSIVTLLHMDSMVMQIAFGTSATVWKLGGDAGAPGKYTWITLEDLEGDTPRRFPARNARNATSGSDGYFSASQDEMAAVPGSPVVYWLSEKMRAAFESGATLGDLVTTREGLTTGDNDRFLRFWWEPSTHGVALPQSFDGAPPPGKRWFAYLKGGTERCWSGNYEYVVDWERDGERQRLNIEEHTGRVRSHNYNGDWAFRSGITWTGLTSGRFCSRAMGRGFMFDAKGPVAFPHEGRTRNLLLSILNSSVGAAILAMLAPTMDFKLGQIERVPIPAVAANGADQVSPLCETLVAASTFDWDTVETAWGFADNPLVTLSKNRDR